jgi:Protein of unknown function (DUF3574)
LKPTASGGTAKKRMAKFVGLAHWTCSLLAYVATWLTEHSRQNVGAAGSSSAAPEPKKAGHALAARAEAFSHRSTGTTPLGGAHQATAGERSALPLTSGHAAIERGTSDPHPLNARVARLGWALPSAAGLALASACMVVDAPLNAGMSSCKSQTQSRLYFGLDAPGGRVPDASWSEFVDRTVTPRFPQGLTLLEGRGQWRDAKGVTLKESSRVIEIVHADTVEERQALSEIVGDYKARFHQESVLLTQATVRACF